MARPRSITCAVRKAISATLTGGLVALLSTAVFATEKAPRSTESQSPFTCHTLSVGGANGWEPISYVREDGQHTGLGIDILQDYAKHHNIRLKRHLDIPWTRTLQMLRKGELDVLTGAYFTNERDQSYFYSAPFANDDIMVFQHRERDFAVKDLNDLIGHRGARPQGGSYGEYIDQFAEQRLDMIFSPTGDRIFDVLLSGRVDYVMLGRFDGMTNLHRDKVVDQIKMIEPPIDRNEVYFLFSRQSPCMRHVKNINLHIEKLAQDGTLAKWTENHLIDLTSDSGS